MATAEAPPAHIERQEGKAGVGGPEQEAAPAGEGLFQRVKAAVGLGGKEGAGKRGTRCSARSSRLASASKAARRHVQHLGSGRCKGQAAQGLTLIAAAAACRSAAMAPAARLLDRALLIQSTPVTRLQSCRNA